MANDVNRACKLYNDKILSKSIFSLVSEYYMHLHSLFPFILYQTLPGQFDLPRFCFMLSNDKIARLCENLRFNWNTCERARGTNGK